MTVARRLRWSLLLFGVLALLAAACGAPQEEGQSSTALEGGGEEQEATPQSEDAQAEAGDADGEPIQVAFIGDFVNAVAPYTTASAEAVEIAFAEVNADGGIDGRPLELQVFDDTNDPIQTVNIASRVASDVAAVIIASGSSNVLAAGPNLEENGIPFFVTVSSNPAVTESGWEWVNRVHLSDADQIDRVVDYAVEEMGLQRIGAVHDTSDYGQGGAALIIEALDRHGMEVASDQSYNVGENNFATQINALREADLDAVVFWGLLDAAAGFTEQMESLGMGDVQLFGGGGLVSDQYIELAGEAAGGTIAAWAYLDPENPVASTLAEEYEAQTDGRALDVFAAQSYDAANILAAAMREAGTEPEALQAAIRGMEHDGAVGELTFDETGQNVRTIYLGLVENGDWTLIEE